MKIKDVKLVEAIHDLAFRWQKKGLVHDSRNHSVYTKSGKRKEVTFGNDGVIFKDNEFSSISEYCNLVENKQYSMLLSDGSFFQISYTLNGDQIIKHRLCWYPCPVELNSNDLYESSITDIVLEKMQNADVDHFRLRSPLRFDYAPEQFAENHPVVHLHMSEESCRIPVRSALSIKEFITFIVTNFYDYLVNDTSLYLDLKDWEGRDTLTDSQKGKLHLNVFKLGLAK